MQMLCCNSDRGTDGDCIDSSRWVDEAEEAGLHDNQRHGHAALAVLRNSGEYARLRWRLTGHAQSEERRLGLYATNTQGTNIAICRQCPRLFTQKTPAICGRVVHGWVDPRVGLGWVGSRFFSFQWVWLGRLCRSPKVLYFTGMILNRPNNWFGCMTHGQ